MPKNRHLFLLTFFLSASCAVNNQDYAQSSNSRNFSHLERINSQNSLKKTSPNKHLKIKRESSIPEKKESEKAPEKVPEKLLEKPPIAYLEEEKIPDFAKNFPNEKNPEQSISNPFIENDLVEKYQNNKQKIPAKNDAAGVINKSFSEVGFASWYGHEFYGKKTASGEVYHKGDMTAAHKTLPFSSMVLVTNLSNGKSTKVRINDRGPFSKKRIIDVSEEAAKKLGFKGEGTIEVRVEYEAEEKTEFKNDL